MGISIFSKDKLWHHLVGVGGAVVRVQHWRTKAGSWVRILLAPLRNFGNSVYQTLPVSFGGETKTSKSRQFLLFGVYAKESKIPHTWGKCVTCRGLQNSEINLSCVSPRTDCLENTKTKLLYNLVTNTTIL